MLKHLLLGLTLASLVLLGVYYGGSPSSGADTVTESASPKSIFDRLKMNLQWVPLHEEDYKVKFQFNTNGNFVILQLTDLHFGESEEKDFNTTRVMNRTINEIKPDVVILTGDSISGFAWDGKEQGWGKRIWQNWTKPFLDFKQHYIYAIGNHDAQADLTRREVGDLDTTHPYSLFQPGPDNITGVSNFVRQLYSSNDPSKVVTNFWVMDSNTEGCGSHKTGWGCIEPDQIQWYKEKSAELIAKHGKTRDMAFYHIPIPEVMAMMNEGAAYGNKYDTVCCPDVNTNFHSAIEEIGNIKYHHFGHDHSNDFRGVYGDQEFLYGRKTGYGCYGPPEFMQKGARVLNLTEDSTDPQGFTMENYIIQEDLTREYNQTSVKIPDRQTLCNVGINFKKWGEALLRAGEFLDIVHT